MGVPNLGGRTSVSPLFKSLQEKASRFISSHTHTKTPKTPKSSLLSFVREIPSQNVKLPSLPPEQKVPCTLWKVRELIAKTFWEPLTAGVRGMLPVGMSYRWHLKEKFRLWIWLIRCSDYPYPLSTYLSSSPGYLYIQEDQLFSWIYNKNHLLDSYSSLNTSNSECISGRKTADNSCLPLQRWFNTLDSEISSFDQLYVGMPTDLEDGGRAWKVDDMQLTVPRSTDQQLLSNAHRIGPIGEVDSCNRVGWSQVPVLR